MNQLVDIGLCEEDQEICTIRFSLRLESKSGILYNGGEVEVFEIFERVIEYSKSISIIRLLIVRILKFKNLINCMLKGLLHRFPNKPLRCSHGKFLVACNGTQCDNTFYTQYTEIAVGQ